MAYIYWGISHNAVELKEKNSTAFEDSAIIIGT